MPAPPLASRKRRAAGSESTVGLNGRGQLASTELFDLRGTLAPVMPMHMPRTRHTAVLLERGRVLAAGGGTSLGGGATTAAEIYN